MQELTLTGATLLGQNHATTTTTTTGTRSSSSRSGNHNNKVITTPSTTTITELVPVCTDPSHNHHHHHNHHHNHSPSSALRQLQPQLQLKIPAAELVRQQDDNMLFQTVVGVTRMGPYELFVEIIHAWKEKKNEQQQQQQQQQSLTAATTSNDSDNKNTNNTMSVDELLQQYDSAGHTLAHWCSKRVDDIRFVQYVLTVPFHDAKYPTVVHRCSRDNTGMTPLHWACTMPDGLGIISTLLQKAASGTATTTSTSTTATNILEIEDGSGCTPLLLASQHGQVETVAYLIQKGANVMAVDTSRDSAMHWAAYKGSLSVLGLLTYYDTSQLQNPDVYNQTPLHLASLRGHADVVRYIIQHLMLADAHKNTGGAPPHASSGRKKKNSSNTYRIAKEILFLKDKNGRTPYDLAIHKEKPKVAAVLKQAQETISMDGKNQRYIHILFQTCKSFVSIQSWKMWLGMNTSTTAGGVGGDLDDSESPKFPLYYVSTNILFHYIYHWTIFFPIGWFGMTSTTSEDGVLWDCMGLLITQLVLMILVPITLYCTTTSNPGRLDSSYPNITIWKRLYEETLEQLASIDHHHQPNNNNNNNNNNSNNSSSSSNRPKMMYNLCHTCHIARPHRSKHDRITRSCILQFDHHCPFVGNTIGLYNYKFFYLFCLVMTLYFINYWILFILYWVRKAAEVSSSNTASSVFGVQDPIVIIIGIVLGLHILFPGGMLIYHTQLIYVNLTTNEHINTTKYDYLWKSSSVPTTTITSTNNMNSPVQQQPYYPRIFYNPWDKGFVYNLMDRLFPTDACYLVPEEYRGLLSDIDNKYNNDNNVGLGNTTGNTVQRSTTSSIGHRNNNDNRQFQLSSFDSVV